MTYLVTLRPVRAPQIDFAPLRRELHLPDVFPADAQREADEAAEAVRPPAVDRTDIPLVTIDPAGSVDLDQAMCLQRRAGGGYRVHYAIADVASFVRPGGPLEAETWRRGETVYLPDGKVPLHPTVLSEAAASLLPDVTRPAVLWTLDLDSDGATTAVTLERAAVRSRAKLDYGQVQADVDTGRAAEPVALLPELGKLLAARALARGAINLPMPEQEIERDIDGWRLVLRRQHPVEEYNAQISLLTGVAAATYMLDARVGLLRTMPAPSTEALVRLRTVAPTLGVQWRDGESLGLVISRLNLADPRSAAFLDAAAELLRGAGYTAFDGAAPADPGHGAVAAPYAHVTAPLRRLADRYATEVCLALHSDRPIPDWARAALPKLPPAMAAGSRLAGSAERAAVDLVEALVLAGRVGEEFSAVVVDVEADRKGKPAAGGTVALDDPPVLARCDGAGLPLGQRITTRLVRADPVARKVVFETAARPDDKGVTMTTPTDPDGPADPTRPVPPQPAPPYPPDPEVPVPGEPVPPPL